MPTQGRSSIVFGSSGSWQRAETSEIHPLSRFKDDFLAGFGASARDLARGVPRHTFGSYALTAYALGYRAGLEVARGEKGDSSC